MRFRWRTKFGSLEPKLAKQQQELQKQIECQTDRTESEQVVGLAAGSSVPHRGLYSTEDCVVISCNKGSAMKH